MRLRRPLTEIDILQIKAENNASLEKHDDAIQCFLDILKKNPDTSQEAQALYGLAQAYFDQQRFQDASVAAQRLVALRPANETWIIPHGYFKLGQVFAKLGRIPEAREAFKKVLDFSDYDFQSRLEPRAEAELKKLDQQNQ